LRAARRILEIGVVLIDRFCSRTSSNSARGFRMLMGAVDGAIAHGSDDGEDAIGARANDDAWQKPGEHFYTVTSS
jgi:hypothetical protein